MAQLSLDASLGATNEVRIGPDQWTDHVSSSKHPQIVVGGPGSGKTSFLCARIESAIEDGVEPESILLLTFSRTGVADLKTRLTKLIGNAAHRITVVTYHSLAMRLVEAHHAELGWVRPPALLPGAEQEQLVARLLELEDPQEWHGAFRGVLTSTAMAANVTDFILRNHEQLGSSESVAAIGRDQWKGLPEFLDRYNSELRTTGRIDYGLVMAEALRLVNTSPEVASFDYIVADEYQDTSPVQAQLLTALARSSTHLIVAADPYQSIYSFRGADINNVFDFPSMVQSELGQEAERLVLTTSFRVPTEVLEAAVELTARELPGGAGKVLSTRTGGSVQCHEFGTSGQEAEWIAAEIERLHLSDGVPLERIAVFTRGHGPFVDDVIRSLDRRNIPHTESEDRLTDERVIRLLHDIVATATIEGDEAAASLRRVLLGPFFRLNQGQVSTMPDGSGADLAEWLLAVGEQHQPLADLIGTPAWCNNQPASAGLWTIWSTLPQLEIVASDDEFERDRRAWAAYAQVLERIAGRDEHTTLADHAALSAQFDFEAEPLFSVDDAIGVTISTLHRSKGTEFDVVFIADAVEGALPDLRTRDSLLGVRHLNPNLPTATADYVTFRLDEERRLAYTAMTRSANRVVWTATTATDEGAGSAPSRFMRLVRPTTPASTSATPLTPKAMVSSLRRVLADPQATTVDRLAALSFLATDPTGTGPLDRYGTRREGADHGVITDRLKLSPSQAKSFDDCPRRYVAERFLLSATEESPYMRIGTLLHDVLEAAERNAMSEGRPRSTSEEALRQLDILFPEAGFGSDSVGMAWKRRAATLITNLYENWPSTGVPVDLEVALELEVDGTPWRGRADRIERAGDSVTVVDYKSGKSATIAEAASSLQLGFYAMAVAADPRFAGLGSVDAAEFWYPKDVLKRGISTRSFDMGEIDSVKDRMVEIADAITAEEFPPTPGKHCRTCSVAATCPAMPQGAEAFLP
ncbi:MAG: ATP-dependent helicase [Acidimicrobiia bacterium]